MHGRWLAVAGGSALVGLAGSACDVAPQECTSRNDVDTYPGSTHYEVSLADGGAPIAIGDMDASVEVDGFALGCSFTDMQFPVRVGACILQVQLGDVERARGEITAAHASLVRPTSCSLPFGDGAISGVVDSASLDFGPSGASRTLSLVGSLDDAGDGGSTHAFSWTFRSPT